ncbi:hypothetical protein EDC01DRAFT_413160 [Geopyxis carbonaria]|nr:hypothetical protein EDC01DRAFT_413160 [Geopyxis carbonaria]
MGISEAFAFRTPAVTFFTVVTYLALLTGLLYVHLVPPPVAKSSELGSWGVDLDAAWTDLREITKEYRPYNSHRNDEVRVYLLQRIEEILEKNRAGGWDGEVEVVDDLDSNVFSTVGAVVAGTNAPGLSVYFEGTNIMVYIKGENRELSPVLVNAHYDSVSTGYGATDDGKAVVSILQVINAFTNPKLAGEKRKKRGLIALLNNGEEDYLNGARAFAIHPMGNLSHSFLNLEGAGAGGRATLFRSTDTEITEFYQKSKRPFGTVMADDGFKQGLIRSQTDYKVFVEELGMRGLDVAFWTPRSRYHTEDDDVRHTSQESLWHMLGASLQTLDALMSYTGREFDRDGDVPAGKGHAAVWFDLFGRTFALFRLHTLFAWTITLIVVPFVIMAITTYALYTSNKLYYLSNTPLVPQPRDDSDLPKTTRGWRGFFRFPVAFAIASGGVIGAAFVINKFNPMIAYSSEYSVWVMFMSIWWCLVWFVLRGADAIRPTALGRGYAFIEQWLLWWAILIFVAVLIDRKQLASGYWVLISYTAVFLCAWLSLLELFGLPKKPRERRAPPNLYDHGDSEGHSQVAASEAASDTEETETTPLFRGANRPTTFGGYSRTVGASPATPPRYRDGDDSDNEHHQIEGVSGKEQAWSKDLPSWIWIIQFLIAVPLPLIFTGSLSLFAATAIAKTGADGNSMLTFYLMTGVLSILLLLPVSPFFHRVSHYITTFIFLVFVGTFIYNLTAFPFSPESRLKVYFQQTVDIDTGANTVHLVGHEAYIAHIVSAHLPSAHGVKLEVKPDTARDGLTRVSWPGMAPNVIDTPGDIPPEKFLRHWMTFNSTSTGAGSARLFVSARESRACKLVFHNPVASATIVDRDVKQLGAPVTDGGIRELRLWSRTWEEGWTVDVEWDPKNGDAKEHEKRGVDGKVVCLWSDANDAANRIPALEEARKFLPQWAVVTKLSDGLVEGERRFML